MSAAINPSRGSKHYKAKFTEAEVKLILNAVAERERLRKEASELSNAKLAEKFEVHPRTIDKISQRRTWTHV